MAKSYPRLVRPTDSEGSGTCEGPPESEDPRAVFRLQVMEDLEEERGLLYRFIAIGLMVTLAIIIRQILILALGGG